MSAHGLHRFCVFKQIRFGLAVPQSVVLFAYRGKAGEERVPQAGIGKVIDGGQGQIDVGVYELLAAGDPRQMSFQ